jgi:uncharacterized protein (UPF0147 family)
VDADDIELITQLQLLRLNTGEQHPFADRLIEYLLENVIIDSPTEVPNNVRRVQKALKANNSTNNYSAKFKGI